MDGFEPPDFPVNLEKIRKERKEFKIREETTKEKLLRKFLIASPGVGFAFFLVRDFLGAFADMLTIIGVR